MKIIRARLKPYPGSKANEYLSTKGRIKSLIDGNKKSELNFVIEVGRDKSLKEFGPKNINPELVGKTIPIVDGSISAVFNEDGTVDVVTTTNESRIIKKFNDFKY